MGNYFNNGDCIQLRPGVPLGLTCRESAQTEAPAGASGGDFPLTTPAQCGSHPGRGRGFPTLRQVILVLSFALAGWIAIATVVMAVWRAIG